MELKNRESTVSLDYQASNNPQKLGVETNARLMNYIRPSFTDVKAITFTRFLPLCLQCIIWILNNFRG